MADLTGTIEYIKQKCLNCNAEIDYEKSRKHCPNCNAAELLSIASDPLIGTTIAGKYIIKELIGSGGMARVYSAQHEHLGIEVAIKVLAETGMSVDRLQRFQQEAKQASSINHPNMVRILDFGIIPSPFIVMERAIGCTLADLIKESKGLDSNTAIKIGTKICDAMYAAHQAGLLHRDLKPSNIMVDRDSDTVKIIDFGLVKAFIDDVKLTKTGETVGSPPYMSPEQCRGEPLDAQADIYSFGCSLYEMLTGILPFDGENMIASIFKHLEVEAPPLSKARPDKAFPQGIETVLRNCLSKSVQNRYKTMLEVRTDLQKVLDRKKVLLLSPGSKKKRDVAPWRFALLAPVPILVYFLVGLERPPTVVPTGNDLAVGEQAKLRNEISVELQPRTCLNGMTRDAVFSLRQKQLDRYSQLLQTAYKPFPLIYKDVDFNAPWISFEGLFYYKAKGPAATEGKSAESEEILNPLLLVNSHLGAVPKWRKSFITNTKRIHDFPYATTPRELTFDPPKRTSTLTVDFTDYYEKVLEMNDWANYKNAKDVQINLSAINAYDFGYNYMYVTAQSSSGQKKVLTPTPRRTYHIYHKVNGLRGVTSNWSHVAQDKGNEYYLVTTVLRIPSTETVALFKTEPKSANQPPDFTCILNYEYDENQLNSSTFLEKRLKQVISEEGADSTSLLSIYRRLGETFKKQGKYAESSEALGQAVRVASLHNESKSDLEDSLMAKFALALDARSSDEKLAQVQLDSIATKQKWNQATLTFARNALAGTVPVVQDYWQLRTQGLCNLAKYENAIDLTDKGIGYFPKDAHLWCTRAAAFGFLSNRSESVSAAKKALELDPDPGSDSVVALTYSAWQLLEESQTQTAVSLLQECLRVDQHYSPAYETLIACHLKLGDRRSARTVLDAAFANCKSQPKAIARLRKLQAKIDNGRNDNE